ncbi:MAG: hypothetical protein HYY40_11605 [Bacteroidetes bacterium]|nr:hypothetical protein [Bacteroidota bacterium]
MKLNILLSNLFNLFLFLALSARAQDLVSLVRFADSRLDANDPDEAFSSFNRAFFFLEVYPATEITKSYLLHRMGDCHFKTGKFGEAIRYYGLAVKSAGNDTVRNDLVLMKIKLYLLQKDFYFALEELLIMDTPPLPDQRKMKEIFSGIAWFGLENFDSAGAYFNRLAETDSQKVLLSDLLKRLRKIKHPNPNVAQILSIFLPGLGQFYAGDLKNGLNSLIITGGLFALGINVVLNYSWIDAILAVMPWYQRYYLGGVQNAGNIARYRLEEKRSRIYKEIMAAVDSKKH